MNKGNAFVVIAVALCAILAAGAILASNMAFKVNYPLVKAKGTGPCSLRPPTDSCSGTQTLALPYFRQQGVNTAMQLIQDIENTTGTTFTKVVSVSRFVEASDSLFTYTGRRGTPNPNFDLTPGEGYRVQMSADTNYIIVGGHDPALAAQLEAAGSAARSSLESAANGLSNSGTSDYAPPYNLTAPSAMSLIQDIEGTTGTTFSKVVSVSRFLTASDSLFTYTGRRGTPNPNFLLVTGESYRIQMSSTVPYIASHY